MAAPLPAFSDGDFPLAETLPRVCPWCHGPQLTTLRGPREARFAVSEHPDRRTCDSNRHRPSKYVRTTHCYNVSDDLAAVVLDRVAELPRRWARVRVEVDIVIAIDWVELYSYPRLTRFAYPAGARFVGDATAVDAICHAHPTDSQHLAECLLNDPEIDNLLRDVREKHEVPVSNQRVAIPYLNALDFVGTITVGDGTQPIYAEDFQ